MTRQTRGPIRVAYDVIGEGEDVLLVVPGWVSHLDYDWSTPEIRRFYERLAKGRRVIRYDKRGVGLSDRPTGAETYALEAQVEDVLAVLDAAGVERVAIFAWSMGGPIALKLATEHPERVSAMVLYGTYSKALAARDYPRGIDYDTMHSIMSLTRAQWGLGSGAIAQFFIPESDEERIRWFTLYQRVAMSPQTAADFVGGVITHDVRPILSSVETPTLVLHRREDTLVPFALGEYLADSIPGASFRALTGQHHTPYFGDSEAVTRETDLFLRALQPSDDPPADLTQREIEVLRLLADGLRNRDIADHLMISPATVGRHVANIFNKLGVSSRAAAAAYALRHGFA
jgi:pimeloyl-ACP methyl ester carboxylesterase/DNA-binding CsgD family transcriptional regulator